MSENERGSIRRTQSEGPSPNLARFEPKTEVLDRSNLYAAGRLSQPYLTMPSWFRRFVFQVLKPRELQIYIYLCSVMNPRGIAFPLIRQMQEDLGVRERDTIIDGIDRLENTGFILRQRRTVQLRSAVSRNVYQRPAPEFTVLTLLRANEIGADLFPIKPKGGVQDPYASLDAVRLGLQTLTNDEGGVDRWIKANGSEKEACLVDLLNKSLQRKIRYADHI